MIYKRSLIFSVLIGSIVISGCSSTSFLSSSGPSRSHINDTAVVNSSIQIVDVDSGVARQLIQKIQTKQFSDLANSHTQSNYVVGMGDAVEISVWEAPPATLFGAGISDIKNGSSGSKMSTFPEQVVQTNGMINVPFVGQVKAAGKSLHEIEKEIVKSLQSKANQPQVLVRLSRNNSSNVTVVGDVGMSVRMPLTPRGERVLDALAAAGGVKQPINKMSLQLTRANTLQSMPLEKVIQDPKQNILLQPGDVLTALFQSQSFTVLGATGKNEEQNFEAQGISLAQALARSGGLRDERSDAQGVFIFRFEDENALEWKSKPLLTPEGKVPVIYRVDLKNPATFFVAQSFPIRDKDVLYVSNAPAAEMQKFLNIVTSTIFTITAPFSSGLIQQ